MLVSAKEMLNKAREGKYAVGQFNINNLTCPSITSAPPAGGALVLCHSHLVRISELLWLRVLSSEYWLV